MLLRGLLFRPGDEDFRGVEVQAQLHDALRLLGYLHGPLSLLPKDASGLAHPHRIRQRARLFLRVHLRGALLRCSPRSDLPQQTHPFLLPIPRPLYFNRQLAQIHKHQAPDPLSNGGLLPCFLLISIPFRIIDY